MTAGKITTSFALLLVPGLATLPVQQADARSGHRVQHVPLGDAKMKRISRRMLPVLVLLALAAGPARAGQLVDRLYVQAWDVSSERGRPACSVPPAGTSADDAAVARASGGEAAVPVLLEVLTPAGDVTGGIRIGNDVIMFLFDRAETEKGHVLQVRLRDWDKKLIADPLLPVTPGIDTWIAGLAGEKGRNCLVVRVSDRIERSPWWVSPDDGHVTPPRATKKFHPDFPLNEQFRREDARVEIEVLIGANGRPVSAKVVDCPPDYLSLAVPAVRAALRWRFEPARQDGHPKPTWIRLMFTYDA